MWKIEIGGSDVNELLLAEDVHIIPGTPLKNQLVGGRKLLHHIVQNRSVGIAARNVAAHVHRLSGAADEEVGAIFHNDQLVVVGAIAIGGSVVSQVIEVIIDRRKASPRYCAIFLGLKVARSSALVKDRIAPGVEDHLVHLAVLADVFQPDII